MSLWRLIKYLCPTSDDFRNGSLDLGQAVPQVIHVRDHAFEPRGGICKSRIQYLQSHFELCFDVVRKLGKNLGDSLVQVNVLI